MIPRILVPTDVRPLSRDDAAKPARRTTTYMDDRTVVPPDLSDAPPLDGRSAIPAHLPLGVLADRTLVPRGLPVIPLERAASRPDSAAVAVLDARMVVPTDVEPVEPEEAREFSRAPELTPALRELVDPDVFITGSPNLLIEPEAKREAKSDVATRIISVGVHVALVLVIVFAPRLFPDRQPTQAQLELSRDQLNLLYTPPEPALPPAPKLRISPRAVERLAPTEKTPEPAVPEAAPPKTAPAPTPAPEPPKSAAEAPPPPPKAPEVKPIEPERPTKPLNLGVPVAPGRMLQRDIQQAVRQGDSGRVYTPPGGAPQTPGSTGGPGMQPGLSILTPTEGVDFNPYMQRVIAAVKRNWYAIMPESAWMGDKGVVSTTFRINRDGSVPQNEPNLERTSGKQPLDLAALSSIRASNPFPPLPSEFKGPYIELRFVFFYNIKPDSSYAQ